MVPFSMMLISLILRPIMFHLRIFCPSVTVRILADDILLTQDCDDASEFVDAFNRLHYFLHKLGAKLALDKSYLFPRAQILESFSKHTLGSTSTPRFRWCSASVTSELI